MYGVYKHGGKYNVQWVSRNKWCLLNLATTLTCNRQADGWRHGREVIIMCLPASAGNTENDRTIQKYDTQHVK